MSKPIISMKGVKMWFPIRRGFISKTVGHVKAVDGIDLEILEGETVGR
ncbi:MAG: dipeptide/oligopeptide/nickel ABC transporter ATP-binding protein, partial [Lentisphaeria bacterium]|nr:dipeptide/oligopeptide/nickel ABC transporter ATP-binding protein [Lentisphaeria bacterium]